MLKYLHNSGIFSIFAVWKQPQDHTDEWSWRRPIFPPSLPARPGRSSSRCSSTPPPPLIWPVSPAAPSCRRKSPPSSPSSAHLEIGKKCLRVTEDGSGVPDGKPGGSGIPPKPPCEGGRGFLRTGLWACKMSWLKILYTTAAPSRVISLFHNFIKVFWNNETQISIYYIYYNIYNI